jgi:hypothetical protein
MAETFSAEKAQALIDEAKTTGSVHVNLQDLLGASVPVRIGVEDFRQVFPLAAESESHEPALAVSWGEDAATVRVQQVNGGACVTLSVKF